MAYFTEPRSKPGADSAKELEAEQHRKELAALQKANDELTAEVQSLREHLDPRVFVYYDRAKARKAKA